MVYVPEQGGQNDELDSAYQELSDAINKIIRLNKWNVSALSGDDSPMMVSEYLVLVAQQGFDSDGDGISSYVHIAPQGQLPWHRMIGLLRATQLRIEQEFVRDDD